MRPEPALLPQPARPCLPEALTRCGELPFLDSAQAQVLAQLQACTFAQACSASLRFVALQLLRLAQQRAEREPATMESLVAVAHQKFAQREAFDRLATQAAEPLPPGLSQRQPPAAVWAASGLRHAWAALGLALHAALRALAHFRAGLDEEGALCPAWQQALRAHWRQEAQHAVLTELAWREEHAALAPGRRRAALAELLALLARLDHLLRLRAHADARSFCRLVAPGLPRPHQLQVEALLAAAYRWQHLGCALQEPRFGTVLQSLVPPPRWRRVHGTLAALAAGSPPEALP